jgi:hypothetical protein
MHAAHAARRTAATAATPRRQAAHAPSRRAGAPAVDERLQAGVVAWLGLGLIALWMLPALRAEAHWLYWLLLAPALALAVLHRSRLAAALRAVLVPRPRRRRRTSLPQARRQGFGVRAARRRAEVA